MEFPKQRVRIATLQECEQVSVCEEVWGTMWMKSKILHDCNNYKTGCDFVCCTQNIREPMLIMLRIWWICVSHGWASGWSTRAVNFKIEQSKLLLLTKTQVRSLSMNIEINNQDMHGQCWKEDSQLLNCMVGR
jgi:hypothetical protein